MSVTRPRPAGVALVAAIAWVNAARQILTGILLLTSNHPDPDATAAAWATIIFGLSTGLVSLSLFRGRNAARILVAVVVALNVVSALAHRISGP